MRLGLGLGVNKGRRKMGSIAEGVIAALEAQAASDGYTAFNGDTKDASLVMVNSLVEAGVWDKADLFSVYATNGDRDFATYNWVDPTSNYGTQFNTPTFTSLQGFTGNGTNMYISHGNVQDKSSQNNVSIGFFQRSSSSGITSLNVIGAESSTTLRIGNNFSNQGYYRINAGAPSNTGVSTIAPSQILLMADRDASDSDSMYANGSSIGSSSTASIVDLQLIELLRSGSSYSSQQVSFAWKGTSLSPGEHAELYNAVSTYLTAIGSI